MGFGLSRRYFQGILGWPGRQFSNTRNFIFLVCEHVCWYIFVEDLYFHPRDFVLGWSCARIWVGSRIFVHLFVFTFGSMWLRLGFVWAYLHRQSTFLLGTTFCKFDSHGRQLAFRCIISHFRNWWRGLNCYFLLSEGMDAGSQSHVVAFTLFLSEVFCNLCQ